MFCQQEVEFNVQTEYGKFTFRTVCDKVWFMDCTLDGIPFFIRDAFQYFHVSLEKVCNDLQLSNKKFERPDYIGKRKPYKEEKKYFEEYAIQDVISLWEVVKWIKRRHISSNVPISISIADMSGKILRKNFMEEGTSFDCLDDDICTAALLSYHGGKSEYYLEHPAKINDVYEYDIVSAYPYAMTQLPNFIGCKIRHLKYHSIGAVNHLHLPVGLYKISTNTVIKCKHWPIYTHSFKHSTYFFETWITGYELAELLRDEEDIKIHEAYIIEENKNVQKNPLRDFTYYFFNKKQSAENPTDRLFYKIVLNSLYGKFISRIEKDGYEEEEAQWVGGALFNPLIASLITGFVRAYVHRIEDTLGVYHTSTDSFITKNPNGIKLFSTKDGLGSLEMKASGNAYIFRRKLYLICDKRDNIIKSALHGFYADEKMLWKMFKNRHDKYKSTYYNKMRMVRLKEAHISRDPDKIPFVWENKTTKLGIDWSGYKEL